MGCISRLGEGRLKPHLQELNSPTRVSKPLVRVGGLCFHSRVGKASPKGLFYSPGCIPQLLDTPAFMSLEPDSTLGEGSKA